MSFCANSITIPQPLRIGYNKIMIVSSTRIRHLLLDLDNTLYPASAAMSENITKRILDYVASYLKLPFEEAVSRRLQNLPAFGTTLEWLKAEHGLTDEASYFAAVHPESETAELAKDPALRPYLLSLGLPMTLLTNSPMSHAERLVRFFDIADIFQGIYDLTYHSGRGKPHADCFLSTLRAVGFSLEETLFVDDHPKYVRGWTEIGGKAVLVDEEGEHEELARTEGWYRIKSIYELKDLLAEIANS